jgi:glucokinase
MADILAADIGGTNSRFAHFGMAEGEGLALKGTCWLRTKGFQSFKDLIGGLSNAEFSLKPDEADMAAVAVAGPIERGGVYSAPPFIDWDIDISNAGGLGLRRALLINDFVAQAWAAVSPVGELAQKILPGTIAPDGTVAVIGAGTGLGQAALVPDGEGGYIATPSEGGHASFPFVSKDEFEFAEFLKSETGDEYITGNTVVSGGGLSHIHKFLVGEALKPSEVPERLTGDAETLKWAARLYGRAARNYALEVYATGGLYIAGGVAARTPAIVEHEAFEKEFRSSPKMSDVLAKIPVFLITDQESGLWGAAYCGLKRLEKLT